MLVFNLPQPTEGLAGAALTSFQIPINDSAGWAYLDANVSYSNGVLFSTLYRLSKDGICHVMKVSPDGGKLLMELDLEQHILASPAIVGGALFPISGLLKQIGKPGTRLRHRATHHNVAASVRIRPKSLLSNQINGSFSPF